MILLLFSVLWLMRNHNIWLYSDCSIGISLPLRCELSLSFFELIEFCYDF